MRSDGWTRATSRRNQVLGLGAGLVALGSLATVTYAGGESSSGATLVDPSAAIVECLPRAPQLGPPASGVDEPTCIEVDGLDPTAEGPPSRQTQQAICDALPTNAAAARADCEARIDRYAAYRSMAPEPSH